MRNNFYFLWWAVNVGLAILPQITVTPFVHNYVDLEESVQQAVPCTQGKHFKIICSWSSQSFTKEGWQITVSDFPSLLIISSTSLLSQFIKRHHRGISLSFISCCQPLPCHRRLCVYKLFFLLLLWCHALCCTQNFVSAPCFYRFWFIRAYVLGALFKPVTWEVYSMWLTLLETLKYDMLTTLTVWQHHLLICPLSPALFIM